MFANFAPYPMVALPQTGERRLCQTKPERDSAARDQGCPVSATKFHIILCKILRCILMLLQDPDFTPMDPKVAPRMAVKDGNVTAR